MEFTAMELFVMHTAIGNTVGANMADMMRRGRLLDLLEFTDEDKAAIGWREVTLDNGAEVALFDNTVILERILTGRQAEQMRAILASPDAVATVKARAHKTYEAALRKLGWVPMEDE
jgi:hypothetical protein